MTGTFRILMRVYPAGCRAVFGEEMLTAIERAAEDHSKRRGGPLLMLRFFVREAFGIVAGAAREWVARV